MKNKIYWNKQESGSDPFGISKQINKGVSEAVRRVAGQRRNGEGVEFLWIHLAQREAEHASAKPYGSALSVGEWLNLIDEAASFGTRWLVFYVADALAQFPGVWELSRWAQDVHEMNIVLHYTGHELSPELVDELNRLDPSRVTLIVTPDNAEAIQAAAPAAVRVLVSEPPEPNRERCAGAERMTCILADGSVYSCGLVAGQEAYAMGHAEARPLTDIANDETLPHSVEEVKNFPPERCDGCPSRLSDTLSRLSNA